MYARSMTRTAMGVAMLVIGCGSSTTNPTAPVAPRDVSAAPELRCKTAIEQASATIKQRAKDVTMAIGECEQNEWPQPARQCVAAAHVTADLVACETKYSLGTDGILADHLTVEQAMKAMDRFREEMCMCKDTACAQHVSDEMAKWSQDMTKNTDEPWKMTDEETKQATALGEAIGKCMQQAMGVTP